MIKKDSSKVFQFPDQYSYHRGTDCYPGQRPEALHQQQALSKQPGQDCGAGMDFEHDQVELDMDDSASLRPHSTQSTIKWLEDNYHYEDGICLPRSTIYEHYLDFCQHKQLQPVNAASFGKIIRQLFPSLTTRRLGTRGQSKYHYYGLGIKHTSKYYTEEYLQKQHTQGIARKEPEVKKPHAYYASKEKPSAVLPPFPDVKKLSLSESIRHETLHTFMVMYRAHCQRILDSVVRATFDEVENFLLHFWQAMPSHLLPVLGTEVVIDLVAVCDTILYKAISDVYITSPLQLIPENVAHEIYRFSNNLKPWLDTALKGLPDVLRTMKQKVANTFSKNLRRQRSLMNLADAARNQLQGLAQLKGDWSALDMSTILAHTLYAVQPFEITDDYINAIPLFLQQFSGLISEESSSVEDFVCWIEEVISKCVRKSSESESVKEIGRVFLLTWKFFTSKIVREFTLMGATSYGTFHLIHMLIDDFILHSLETMLEKEQQNQHMHRINLLRQDEPLEDIHTEDTFSSIDDHHSSKPTISTNVSPEIPLVAQPAITFTLPPDPTTLSHGSSTTSHDQHHMTEVSVGGGGGSNPITPIQSYPTVLSSSLSQAVDSGELGSRLGFLPSMQTGSNPASHISNPAMPPELNHGLSTSNSPVSESFGSLIQSTTPSLQGNTHSHLVGSGGLSVTSSGSRMTISPIPVSIAISFGSNVPHANSSTTVTVSHSQPQVQIPATLSMFTPPSMMSHFATHTQLQSHSLPLGGHSNTNPVGHSSRNPTGSLPATGTQNLSLTRAPNIHGSGIQNNPQANLALTSTPNLPTAMQMPLTHPIAAGSLPPLPNPAGLPLLPNMYSYPYAANLPPVQSLPSQPISSTMVRVSAPGFPAQTLVPGYPSYVPPTLYGSTQPPISTGSFSR